MCKTEFERIVTSLQDNIDKIMKQQFQHMDTDLQILKDDNAILELEQDLAFRDRLIAHLAFARGEMLECCL